MTDASQMGARVTTSPGRAFIRRLGFGRALFRYVYRPLQPYRWLAGFGWRGAAQYIWGERRMRRIVHRLAPCSGRPNTSPAFAVTYLTGHHHWHQTVVAAYSLALKLPGILQPTFVDDGALRPEEAQLLQRIFPSASILTVDEGEQRLDRVLPPDRYPALRAARKHHAFMRKLLDPRVESNGWQLYLDSDMLFFRPPTFLVECGVQRHPCYMVDQTDAYVRPAAELTALCGRNVPPRANGGIVALDDRRIDWDQVERWAAALGPEHPMLEQTLTAMLHAQQESLPAPERDYYIIYSGSDQAPESAVMLHYIYRAKLRFRQDCERALEVSA